MEHEIKQLVDEVSSLVEEKKVAFETEKAKLESEISSLKESVNTMEKQLYRGNSSGLVTDSSEIKSFTDFLRSMDRKYLRTDSDPEGGYLVPAELHNQLVQKLIEVSPLRQMARVVNITGRGLEVPAQDANAVAYWVGEGLPATATNPLFNKINIVAHKVNVEMRITHELLGDAAFDMAAMIVDHAARLLAAKEGAAFINGNGVNQPQGIMNAAGVLNVNNGGASFTNFDKIADMVAAMKYRNPVFLMNRNTLAALRKLKDTTNQYLLGAGPNGAMPMTIGAPVAELFGIPVMIMQDMPDIGAGTKPIVLVDAAEAYMIVDRMGIGMIRDNVTLVSNGMVKFIVNRRVGGAVVQPEAIVTITMS